MTAVTDETQAATEVLVDRLTATAGTAALHALRRAILPEAYLRAVMPSGRHPWEVLTGLPEFAGALPLPDGRVQAGIYLGDPDGDGRFVLDVTEPEYLRALMAACARALAQLEPRVGPSDTLTLLPVP